MKPEMYKYSRNMERESFEKSTRKKCAGCEYSRRMEREG